MTFEHEAEFIARVHNMIWCNLATLDSKNRVRSRIVHPIWESTTCWLASRRNTPKAKHVAHNAYVSLAYIANIANPVYAECTAEWADSLADKGHVWELFRSTPPPLGFDYGKAFAGPEDPEFGVLKLTPWRIELYDIDKARRKIWVRPYPDTSPRTTRT